MAANQNLTEFGPPVPELPVADVERAQQHYREALGFEIGWLYPDKGIGSASRGKTVIFFRKKESALRTCHPLDLRGRDRSDLSGTQVTRCEHRRSS